MPNTTDSYDGQDDPMNSSENRDQDQEYPCLVRATDGKTIHFSTRVRVSHFQDCANNVIEYSCLDNQVNPGDLERFHTVYGTLLKTSMTTLRKRDKKREKQRAEQQATRKRKLADSVVVAGPKRGNGRKKRQRLVNAALRQEESRKKTTEREELRSKGPAGRDS